MQTWPIGQVDWLGNNEPAGDAGNGWTWMPDSRTWIWLVEEENGMNAGVYESDRTRRHVNFRINNPEPRLWVNSPTLILGITREGSIVSTTWSSETVSTLHTLTFPVDHSFRRAEITAISLPFAAFISGVKLSPAANQIAWILSHDVSPPWPVRRLNRLLGRKTKSINVFEIWVCNLDGSKWRKVGLSESGVDSAGLTTNYPCCLRWLPDGKQISFIMNDELRVLRVK
jgi:hypothetical protein